MERDSFIFRKKWYEALKELDAETKAQAFDAICQFAIYHKQVEVSPMVKMAMAFIMPELTEDCLKWIGIKEKRSEAANARWNKDKQDMQMHANASNCTDCNANYAVSSLVNVNNCSFFLNMCAAREEKKEELLFGIGKEMLRKGAANPSKEAEAYISYNDSQGWLLKNGRCVSDPVAWAKNWSIKNPSAEIQKGAEAYIMILKALHLEDRKMLDCFKKFNVSGNTIQLILSSKKAAERFVHAEENNAARLLQVIKLCFPKIENPSLTYITPR